MRQAMTQDGRAPAQTGTPALAEQVDQYLTFVLGGEVFAIGILGIKEIIEYTHLTTVPMTPEYVRGVINLRGAVVPVLDLLVRFGKPSSPVTKRTCNIIIEVEAGAGRHDIGIVVDTVNAVLDIPASEIEPDPELRHAYPHRVHLRHGQGQWPVRDPAGCGSCSGGGGDAHIGGGR